MALPNFVSGIGNWAKDHKPQAAGIAGLVLLVVIVFSMRGGGPEQGRQEASGEDMFGAGAMPDDATTASAIRTMEVRMETLQLALNQQRETDAKMAQALEHQKNMLETRLGDQERMYTEQLEAALRQAIELGGRRSSAWMPSAQAAPAPRPASCAPGAPGTPGEPAAPPPPRAPGTHRAVRGSDCDSVHSHGNC